MALQGGRLILDENNLHYDGTLPGGKFSVSKAQKNNGISKSKNFKSLHTSKHSNSSARKIFGDLTNSEKPRSHQASYKKAQEFKNMDSIIMDDHLQVLKPCETGGIVGSCMKAKKAVQQTGGRKALGDLTNTHIPSSIEHEGFMHNHKECIKAKAKAKKMTEMMDMDYFLESIGQESIKLVSAPLMSFSKDDDDDDDLSYLKEWTEIPNSPIAQPKSTNYSTSFMKFEEDDDFLDLEWMVKSPDFKLKGSPSP